MAARHLQPLVLGCCFSVAASLAPASADAQLRPHLELERVPAPRAPSPRSSGLSGLVGVDAASRLARSGDAEERLRGIERLGRLATTRALDILVGILDGGSGKGARDRLTAVRALAPHAGEESVRRTLLRVMTGASGKSAEADLEDMVRQTAALALAAAGDTKALDALGKALRQEGPAARAAALALMAHPPRKLAPIVSTRGAPTTTLIELLAELGDQRAFHPLRDIVRRGSPQLRAQAAIALTRMGHYETVPVAKHWLKRDGATELKRAGAQILVLTHEPQAKAALAELLSEEDTRELGLELIRSAPRPEVAPLLLDELKQAKGDEEALLLALLGRTGSPKALKPLREALPRAEVGAAAAHALARMPGTAARELLAKALESAKPEPLAVRAAVARELLLKDGPSRLQDVLSELAKGSGDSRALGRWGQAALDPARARELFREEKDPGLAAQLAGPAAATRAGRRLVARRLMSNDQPELQGALAIALADLDVANSVSTAKLLELLDDPLARPLAARALAARFDDALKPRVARLLSSPDPLVRAHTYRGLGNANERSVLGMLEHGYRFEARASVRRAIVSAASRQPVESRKRLLRLAADLDPAPAVRTAARAALRAPLQPELVGFEVGWVVVGEKTRGALVTHAGGLALPYAAGPDGQLVVPRLPVGPLRVRLASSALGGKAAAAKGPR